MQQRVLMGEYMVVASKWILIGLIFIPVAVWQVSHAAPYYKWVDEQGTIQYTQAPAPQKEVDKVEVDSQILLDSAPATEKLNNPNKKNLKDQNAAPEVADKTKRNTAADAERTRKNAAQCQKLYDALARLQSAQRLRTETLHSDHTVLTEAEKESKIQQSIEQIRLSCL
jgi:Domain of unknown function (DUF4124)